MKMQAFHTLIDCFNGLAARQTGQYVLQGTEKGSSLLAYEWWHTGVSGSGISTFDKELSPSLAVCHQNVLSEGGFCRFCFDLLSNHTSDSPSSSAGRCLCDLPRFAGRSGD